MIANDEYIDLKKSTKSIIIIKILNRNLIEVTFEI